MTNEKGFLIVIFSYIVYQLDTNGEQILCDVNLVAGRAFLGFARYNHGPISFEDLNSKLEKADGATVDVLASDVISAETDSNYSKLRIERRAFPFGKLLNITSESTTNKMNLQSMFHCEIRWNLFIVLFCRIF